MFLSYSELLNSLDSGATAKLTINNRRLNKANFEQSILMPMRDDEWGVYRKEYNQMLLDKATGANGIMQEKYITITVAKNVTIYGHHMNDGFMFADLCKYESENYFREHKAIHFDTMDGFGEYEVVTVFKPVAYSNVGFPYFLFVNAERREDFDDFLSKCYKLQLYDTGVTAEYGDKKFKEASRQCWRSHVPAPLRLQKNRTIRESGS